MRASIKKQMRMATFLPLVVLSLIWASVRLYGQEEVNIYDIREIPFENNYPDPPKKERNIAPEFIEYTTSLDPLSKEKAEVYLDKFIVWTTDSAAAIALINNPDYIKSVEVNGEMTWAITVMTDDLRTGKNLRNRLRKTAGVLGVENYVFIYPGHQFIPRREIIVCLREASDTIPLKQLSDSLNIIANDDDTSNNRIWNHVFPPIWRLTLTNKTRLSLFETIDLVVKKINPSFCQVNWGGNRWIQYFTFDPFTPKQWGLYNRYNLTIPGKNEYTDLGVSRAWNYATGRNINICFIDEGIDLESKDLKGNYRMSFDAATESDTVTYTSFHGTACAGVACAVRNNNYGIAGVAPDANLMFARVNPKDISRSGFATQFMKAIEWAVANGADIISCSLGCYDCGTIQNSINYALYNGRKGKGCVFVAASGNNGENNIIMPGSIDGVMCIGSIDSLVNVSGFSNYGEKLFAVAPGEDVTLLDVGDIVKASGTSYACPAVAGVAALVLEAFPNATAGQVREIIAKTATIPSKVTDTETREYGKWNQKYGYGLVNAYEAVKLAVETAHSNNTLVELPYPDISSVK